MKRNRRNLSPEDKKRKELVRELLKLNPIKDGNDLNSLVKEMVGEVFRRITASMIIKIKKLIILAMVIPGRRLKAITETLILMCRAIEREALNLR